MKGKKKRTLPKKKGASGGKHKKPRNCICGGGPIVQTGPHVVGEKPLYYIMCGACHRALTFGEAASVEFSSERLALVAWDAVMDGTLVYG